MINPHQKPNPPTIQEIKALKFLATKINGDMTLVHDKFNELLLSSLSPILRKSLNELSIRFSLLEIENIIMQIISMEVEAKTENKDFHVPKIRSPKLFKTNLARSKSGILQAFQQLQVKNIDQTTLQNKEKINQQKPKKDLQAGEFNF